jgi:hypothetical protein
VAVAREVQQDRPLLACLVSRLRHL